MEITIQIKSIYGNEVAYPIDDKAKLFASIAGTKTLTRHTLTRALGLGFAIIELDRHGRASRRYAGVPGISGLPCVL
jgi:hypothetical protein